VSFDAAAVATNSAHEVVNPRDQPLDSTIDLMDQMKRGDQAALQTILQRQIPALQRWAHGRVPRSSRGMLDTVDLVQDTIIASLRRLDGLQIERQGALRAYLRQAVRNRVRDLVRRDRCRPASTSLPVDMADNAASPLEQLLGSENVARYEAAVQKLRPKDRDAIVARLELQDSYEQLAVVLGSRTANAARAAVMRAMKRLAAAMPPE
jgi:RNA polymerase sigma-70 factor, ECF subfamily